MLKVLPSSMHDIVLRQIFTKHLLFLVEETVIESSSGMLSLASHCKHLEKGQTRNNHWWLPTLHHAASTWLKYQNSYKDLLFVRVHTTSNLGFSLERHKLEAVLTTKEIGKANTRQ